MSHLSNANQCWLGVSNIPWNYFSNRECSKNINKRYILQPAWNLGNTAKACPDEESLIPRDLYTLGGVAPSIPDLKLFGQKPENALVGWLNHHQWVLCAVCHLCVCSLRMSYRISVLASQTQTKGNLLFFKIASPVTYYSYHKPEFTQLSNNLAT